MPVTLGFTAVRAAAAVAPVGQGFTVTATDLAFILKQIKISEQHAATLSPAHPCDTLVGPGPNQIPDRLTAYGLRTVDGSCNNLFPGRETFAAADQQFPRLTTPVFKAAENSSPMFGPPHPTSYAQKGGLVFDSQPRVISNLIDDQTSTNPAAVAAAGFPVRTQHAPGLFPCTTDPDLSAVPPVNGVPAGCVPSHHTLFIPNVTTDVGLSPPYNSLFTFFGQFFDHGIDQTAKGGGTVFVPLHDDDPLIAGPDHILGTNCGTATASPECADNLPPNLRFMVLTRAQNQPGPDGIMGTADDIQNANNTDSPWVDQSQTYTSHAAHQVFLREYVNNSAGKPVSTGSLLGGAEPNRTGQATWATLKAQAATLLGLKLLDVDVANIPLLAADPYGKFIPGPLRGLPQYVTKTGLVEGDTVAPVVVPADALHFDTPFLTDIAHNADPGTVGPCTTAIGVTPPAPKGCLSPDADTIASADFASQPPGTYDDEMLNAHFTCGDGRCNENIALSAIHQIFHSEHNRLINDIKNTLTNDTSATGVAALAQWTVTTGTPDGWNGERLFQAARYVTEMEYQHLVFEEFARKVQPAVRPFHVYSPDVNPAIAAEFAHAVYRFGHSMLDETVARKNVDGSDNSIPLLTAFLNPPEFLNGGSTGLPAGQPARQLTPEQAAGSVVMGSSDQVGNELDEFVTETLRNNLLGLPLDLPTLNITRAREAGVPPLNDVRRQIFARTNDGQLTPYTSWSDFGQHLKHPESLINFVAAYGQHPSVTSQTTLAGKRAAAKAIVDPGPLDTTPVPVDASDFMFSTSAWASTAAGVTTTGLDNVDLWVGGLAEVTNLFGGLLGSTFNYVFQNQLENLQDGDRLYYINRTTGTNLRAQLEANSFAELIQRNTDGTNTLKSDAFATADCKFQIANLDGTPAGFTAHGSTVADDPATTGCDESKLLLRKPDGTIQYRAINSVNPSGINYQSVYNGTSGVDRIYGGNDNDTMWGGAGNDILEGGGGDDVILGGEGNDIITDSGGNDTLKGGPGNDAIDGGPGNDNLFGGDGQDFINGGAGDNTTFGGPGNDFVMAGAGADVVFGGPGDDWIEGGTGQDLLQGDEGAPFFDDPAQVKPGNDIMIGQPGENDYDAEGGDDLMSANAAIDRFAGAAGFDWAFHQYDTIAADDDMNINQQLVGVPLPVVVNRDRWQETEADSGSAFNDVIKGTNTVPRLTGGAGFSGCDVLDQAGVNRISGLGALLPPLTGDLAPVVAISAMGACPLSGPIWGEGNILLGGTGSDTIEGRGANDIIDGDRYLQVRISVRTNRDDPATETGTTDLMENKATGGTFGPGTAGMTLQAAVFAGLVDPGNLMAVREILTPTVPAPDCGATAPLNCDTAVFSGPRSNYTITTTPATGATLASMTVTQIGANVVGQTVSDGSDTLRNIEQLRFSDGMVNLTPPGAPTGVTATAGNASAMVNWTAPAPNGSSPITSYEIIDSADPATTLTVTLGTATGGTVAGLTNGTTHTFKVRAVNSGGPGAFSAPSNPVTPATVPGAPAAPTATAGNASATLSWARPTSDGGAPLTSYDVLVSTGTTVVSTIPAIAATDTSRVITGLTNGTAYTFQIRAVNAVGAGALSAPSNLVTPAATVTSLAGFTGTTPTRVLDTRTGLGLPSATPAALGAGATMTLTVPNLPAGATAVALNVTATNPTADSWLTIYPGGAPQPTASNLNFGPGQSIPNMVQVPLGPGNTVTIYNNAGTVDVIADLVGSYAPGTGSGFTGTSPTRVLDTRIGTGAPTAPLGAGATMTLTVPGLPAGATAVAMNATVTNPTAASWLTVYPGGAPQPNASNLNYVAGQTIPNMVIVPLGPGNTVTIYNQAGTVEVIADLVGSYAPGTGAGFTGTTPTRVLDTRTGTGAPTATLGAGATMTLTVPGLPAGTTAVAMNVTVTNPTAFSWLTVYPGGAAQPWASNLNYGPTQTIPNMVIVPVGPGNTVTIYNQAGTVDVIADLIGSYK